MRIMFFEFVQNSQTKQWNKNATSKKIHSIDKKSQHEKMRNDEKMWKTPKDGKIKDKMIKKEGKRYRKSASITKKSMAMRKEDKCFEKKV